MNICLDCGKEYSNIAGEGENSSPFSICRECYHRFGLWTKKEIQK